MNHRINGRLCIKYGKGCFQLIFERCNLILSWSKVDLNLALKAIVSSLLLDLVFKLWMIEYIGGFASNMEKNVSN